MIGQQRDSSLTDLGLYSMYYRVNILLLTSYTACYSLLFTSTYNMPLSPTPGSYSLGWHWASNIQYKVHTNVAKTKHMLIININSYFELANCTIIGTNKLIIMILWTMCMTVWCTQDDLLIMIGQKSLCLCLCDNLLDIVHWLSAHLCSFHSRNNHLEVMQQCLMSKAKFSDHTINETLHWARQ